MGLCYGSLGDIQKMPGWGFRSVRFGDNCAAFSICTPGGFVALTVVSLIDGRSMSARIHKKLFMQDMHGAANRKPSRDGVLGGCP